MFGFISGIPVHMTVNDKKVTMAEINFLCVHKKFRTKKLAPVLIKEITRRVHLYDIWQAVYTAGVMIPTPIANSTYWHRGLQPKKLVECGFSSLPLNTPMSKHVKRFALPAEPNIEGLRPMKVEDAPQVHKLLNEFLSQFKFHVTFSQEEIVHFFIPREGIIESFVIEDKSGKITDFISFYSLPSTVLQNP